MTRTIRGLGAAALAVAVVGALVHALIPVLLFLETTSFLILLIEVANGAFVLAGAIAALAVAERVRLARDPWWGGIVLLVGVAIAAVPLRFVPGALALDAYALFQALFLLGPVALLLAAFRAARARGDGARPLAMAIAALFALAQAWLISLGPVIFTLQDTAAIAGYQALRLVAWLLLPAALLAATPDRRGGRRWRLAGGATAALSAGLGFAAIFLMRAPTDSAAMQQIVTAFAVYNYTWLGIELATVAVAVGVALAEPAPPPAPAPPRPPADAPRPA